MIKRRSNEYNISASTKLRNNDAVEGEDLCHHWWRSNDCSISASTKLRNNDAVEGEDLCVIIGGAVMIAIFPLLQNFVIMML